MSWKWSLLLVVFLIGGCATIEGVPVSDQVPRMSIEDLKARLGSPDIVALDIRNGWSWKSSNMKISGAIREDPREFSRWYDKYPKDKTLVLYCT
jgi:rhodanese-related sulfurtransferase